MYAPFKTCD